MVRICYFLCSLLDEIEFSILIKQWSIFNLGVIPDPETETMIMNTFGKHGHPMKKLMRMSYWMPKFKNASPWALPQTIPNSNLEIGKLAVTRMCSIDPASTVETFQTKELEDSIDDTWIVSGQSPIQQELLEKLESHKAVYVEGGFPIWLRRTTINYFILRSEPVPLSKKDFDLRSQFDFDGKLNSCNQDKTDVIIYSTYLKMLAN